MLPTEGVGAPSDPDALDDPYRALNRRIARLDVEEEFATVYLTFEDGTYLVYASRIDDQGVILLDRFSEPSPRYSDYWIFDELEGEIGIPPPEAAPEPGTAFHPLTWQQAVGRTITDLGWDEEGMQVYVHFEKGGYLTLAARAAAGSAFLLGYFSAEGPVNDEYMEFDPPDARDYA